MKKDISADGMIAILKLDQPHYFRFLHKTVNTPDGNQFLVVTIHEFRKHVEGREKSGEHWKYFYEGIQAN